MANEDSYTYTYITYDGDEVVPEINYDRSVAMEPLRDKMREENISGKLVKQQQPMFLTDLFDEV